MRNESLKKHARGIAGNKDGAQDILHDVALVSLDKVVQIVEIAFPIAYIHASGRNTAYNNRHSSGKYIPTDPITLNESEDMDFTNQKYIEDDTMRLVAKDFGIAPNTLIQTFKRMCGKAATYYHNGAG